MRLSKRQIVAAGVVLVALIAGQQGLESIVARWFVLGGLREVVFLTLKLLTLGTFLPLMILVLEKTGAKAARSSRNPGE